jgi:hypothetical protein
VMVPSPPTIHIFEHLEADAHVDRAERLRPAAQ